MYIAYHVSSSLTRARVVSSFTLACISGIMKCFSTIGSLILRIGFTRLLVVAGVKHCCESTALMKRGPKARSRLRLSPSIHESGFSRSSPKGLKNLLCTSWLSACAIDHSFLLATKLCAAAAVPRVLELTSCYCTFSCRAQDMLSDLQFLISIFTCL